MEIILEPWPWYVAGPLITLVMFLLIFMGKKFGMSSNLETMCTMCGADKKADYFNYDWRENKWNLLVMLGAAIGGFIAAHLLSTPSIAVDISEETIASLRSLGFKSAGESYMPHSLFSTEALLDVKSLTILLVGGLLIGFGARYAGGCTSGHAISGLSNLQMPSLVAVIGFFLGGLVMVHLLFPIIF